MAAESTAVEGPVSVSAWRPRPGSFLRAAGILCLLAALVLGAYYVWLVWGTGISTARAQHALRTEFVKRLAQVQATDGPALALPSKGVPVRVPAEGGALGILEIPRIHLDAVVVNGAAGDDLKKGPGHYIGTAYPWEATGTVGIAGHRTTYGHPFWSLDKLQKGDRIRLVTEYGVYDYRVTRTIEVAPSQNWVLEPSRDPTLVLTTCTPRFSASHRLVVFAQRIPDGG